MTSSLRKVNHAAASSVATVFACPRNFSDCSGVTDGSASSGAKSDLQHSLAGQCRFRFFSERARILTKMRVCASGRPLPARVCGKRSDPRCFRRIPVRRYCSLSYQSRLRPCWQAAAAPPPTPRLLPVPAAVRVLPPIRPCLCDRNRCAPRRRDLVCCAGAGHQCD